MLTSRNYSPLLETPPSPDLVVGNLDHIKTIEQACNIKAAFDSLVAYSADQAINRQLITADTATDFLMDELNLSFQEANNRLRRGYVDHAPPAAGHRGTRSRRNATGASTTKSH